MRGPEIPLLCLFLAHLPLAGCQVYNIRERPQLTTEDIVRLSSEGKPPEAIIKKINEAGTVFTLDTQAILDLHAKGVDNKVIDEMLRTEKVEIDRRARYDPYWHHHHYGYPYGHFHHHFYFDPWWCW